MANSDHIKKFDQGHFAWNLWRQENPSIQPDLSGANFERADLSIDMSFILNFSNVNLEKARFHRSELEGVNFSGSNLRKASFMWAEAIVANFDKADLRDATFYNADLECAKFRAVRVGESQVLPNVLIFIDRFL